MKSSTSESERQRIKFDIGTSGGGRSDFASYFEGHRQRKRAATSRRTTAFALSFIFVNIMSWPFGRILVVHSTKGRNLSVTTRRQKLQTISNRTSGFCPVPIPSLDSTAFSTSSSERRIVAKNSLPPALLQEKTCPRLNLSPNHSLSHPFEAKRFSSWSLHGASKESSAEIRDKKNADKDDLKSSSENENTDRKTIHDKWNVKELLKETERLTIRCTKKIGKANTRYENSMEVVSQLLVEGANPSVEELDRCPDVASIEQELNELRQRLKNLHQLEAMLIEFSTKVGKKKLQSVVLPEDVASLALQMEVKDSPPKRLSPAQKKRPRNPNNNNSNGPRKPYRTYLSKHDVEIRVGKQAGDNDELSINPEHRDGADWWMHASGCPGSHVVIRSHDEPLDQDIIKDAAALAARQSKCNGQTIKVSMVRCRDVSKPPGAKPGLVQLRGNIRTITVNMKEAEKRLLRLDETVII